MAFFVLTAVRTGLEPATHGVTGRYSNQLNYRTSRKTSCKIKLIFFSAKFITVNISVLNQSNPFNVYPGKLRSDLLLLIFC
jgi:hypothetical protein